MSKFTVVVHASRPKFLLLSALMVLFAAALASYQGHQFSLEWMLLVVLSAVVAHICVNLLNEYQDFQSGLDVMTKRTPFSGGSGALPNEPLALDAVWFAFKLSMLVLVLLGLVFIYVQGWQLLPIGIVGLLLIIFYTSKITRLPWLCLISPGLAFGPLMVVGSYYVLTGEFSLLALAFSMTPFFLVNNLLLLNQIPDLDADKQIGRFNLIMLLGVKSAMRVFVGFTLLAFISLVLVVEYYALPAINYLALSAILLAIPMIKMLLNQNEYSDKLMSALTMNVIINLLTPSLLILSLWLSF